MKLALPALAGLLLAMNPISAADPDEAKADDYVRVEIRGTLKTGIVAIGGETTGTTITADDITWEVDLGRNAELRQAAERLSGKTVVLRGELERKRGVEIRERWIVHATALEAAKESPDFSAIEVHQTGGFAGVDIHYRIEADGRFEMKSRRRSAKGKLSDESLKALAEAVNGTDWSEVPKRLKRKNTADDFEYEFTVDFGSKSYTVQADGLSAGKQPPLDAILKALLVIQRTPPKR